MRAKALPKKKSPRINIIKLKTRTKPETEIPSYGVALESTEITVEELESRMRNLSVPVIGRIKEGRFLLDMRTFSEEGIEYLATQIRHIMERKHN